MSEHNGLVCQLCGHEIFTVHRGAFYCCKCGLKVASDEAVPKGGRCVDPAGAFEPPRRIRT